MGEKEDDINQIEFSDEENGADNSGGAGQNNIIH